MLEYLFRWLDRTLQGLNFSKRWPMVRAKISAADRWLQIEPPVERFRDMREQAQGARTLLTWRAW